MGRIPTCQPKLWDTSLLPPRRWLWDASQMATLRKPPPEAAFVARELYRRMLESDPPFNQKSLAAAAGLNVTYVRDILVGKSKNPKSEHLHKLAGALGCESSDLTDPGRSSGDELPGELANRFSERAIVEMWRILSPHGKELAFRRIAELLPGRAPDIGRSIPRKG
jgi:transcriptional regulator with XRE-family HTH domain